MHWLLALDVELLRFINQTLSNPVFDFIMPIASGKGVMPFLLPAILVAGGLLIWKGGTRGRLCALMLALIVWPGDSFISNTIKHAVARPRPFVTLADVRQPGSKPKHKNTPAVAEEKPTGETRVGSSGIPPAHNSMPSSHAANWFAATMILLVYFRRSWRFMLPLACLVAFSRVYNGVHYPSDVLAGAILGAGYAVAGIWALNWLWQKIGRRWFPLWWERLPSLVVVDGAGEGEGAEAQIPDSGFRMPDAGSRMAGRVTQTFSSGSRHPGSGIRDQGSGLRTPASGLLLSTSATLDSHWVRLGYIVIALLLLGRLIYIGSGLIQLTEDEAYQWVWSKHLALSYYSKPPLIAYTQFLGTHLWGDTEFGVRFFSPVIGALLGAMLLRFFAREVNARAGFLLLLVVTATPLMALGSVLMTIDPLSVLFWTAAMLAGWRAVQPGAKAGPWLWTGLWMGVGFLSKYTELFQLLCWVVFFSLWKPARAHLRRPGPYLALLINLVLALPVLIWNAHHGWITVTHVGDDARIGAPWHPTLDYFFDFMGKETALLNPVFFLAAIWASIAMWRRHRHDPRLVYLFSMGAPLFLSYLLYTFHSGVLPNWIAPSVLPLFCVMAIYWDTRWRLGVRPVRRWFIAGLCVGLPIVALLHDTDLVRKIAGRPLPPKPDPLTRVRAYRDMARVVNGVRTHFMADGKPVFIIGGHYGTTGLLSFYLPEAKTNVTREPLVYYLATARPQNQFYFWPSYLDQRRGQDAIFVREVGSPPLVHGWFFKWLDGETNLVRYQPQGVAPPPQLFDEFQSVTNLGLYNALYHGRVFHTLQIYGCRDLR